MNLTTQTTSPRSKKEKIGARFKKAAIAGLLVIVTLSITSSRAALSGIGAAMFLMHRPEGYRLKIVGIVSNSPAAVAGLQRNEIVLSIDGV